MTKEQIKIACAELDGWSKTTRQVREWQCTDYQGGVEAVLVEKEVWCKGDFTLFEKDLAQYADSYDAILPLIQKQDKMVICEISRRIFKEYSEEGYGKSSILQATAMQLCVNLLKATGKWKE